MAARTATVGEYIASQPAAVRGILARVRGAIRKGMPRAEETISYRKFPRTNWMARSYCILRVGSSTLDLSRARRPHRGV